MSSAGQLWNAVRSRLPGGRRTDRGDVPCRCGHVHEAHEHYRAGNDCALCSCRHYRRA